MPLKPLNRRTLLRSAQCRVGLLSALLGLLTLAAFEIIKSRADHIECFGAVAVL